VESTDRQYFEILKAKIVEAMQRTHADISRNMEDWKGDDIIKFQEDLKYNVKEYMSEKSFYNHFKTYHEKLPRIDLLNILSRYAGYSDWSDLRNANRDKIVQITTLTGSNKAFYTLPVIALLVFIMIWSIIRIGSTATYKFCFVDKISKERLSSTKIDVEIILENESPIHLACYPDGCFTYRTGKQKIKFLVKAPYYFTDTITRFLNKARRSEEIQLRVDNYALMINYFSNSKVVDWEKRKKQLERIIADSAFIYQVFGTRLMGMELYNKDEFIDMLTIPASSLKNIEIIDILYQGDKITFIKFRQDY
jgi:hypothetical protein